ncbi:putative S-acyltransferase [Acorus gramineus]|uniref:S-acyltransferase n=1 Tax=Acorus gramineus TaxID=55184 RepID=A0AAV9B7M8_ACOGR|nr:putative S-acyltransferase [Acorus gramineus]
MGEEEMEEKHTVDSVCMDLETTCWGCGLKLLLQTSSPIFKCGWCGAISNQNKRGPESACFSRWRILRDGFFVCIVLVFIFFIICSGVWAVYPIVFAISYFSGVFHSIVTAMLSICTISSFCSAAFHSPGAPPSISWGSYPMVGKGGLEIGNCVGAANHRHFVVFLITVIISCTYVTSMAIYAGLHHWPPLQVVTATGVLKEFFVALMSSAILLTARGLLLLYLCIASISLAIGLIVLLWQQLHFIYEGKTYIGSLSSRDYDGSYNRGCHNLIRFFSCPYPIYRFFMSSNNVKSQEMTVSKLL